MVDEYQLDGGSPKRPGEPVDRHRLLGALRRGRKTIIGVTLAGVVLGLLAAKVVMGNDWETSVLLQYEGDVTLEGVDRRSAYALGPAAEAVHRRSVLARIREETDYPGPLFTLANLITYEPDFRAMTLRIIVRAPSAELVKEFADDVTEVFLSHHKERQARRIELEIKRIQNRIEGAREEAQEARQAYNEFREEHGISNLSSDQLSVVDSAADYRAQSELLGSEVRSMEARVSSLRSQLETIPKTTSLAGDVNPQRRAYDDARQQLAAAQASLSPDHPRVQALQQQVDQLGSSAMQSPRGGGMITPNTSHMLVSRELREAEWALTGLRERQAGLDQMASRAEERLDSFSGVEGQASSLLAEVEVNQNLLRQLTATEASLEDALEQPPSGFVVLDPGSVPDLPVANKMKLVVFGAFCVLSLLLGLLIALRREFRGLRVRTPSELAFWGDGPVLGATAWPVDPRGLEELVAGLDDQVPDAHGSFLLVGGTAEESPLARELSHRLNSDWFQEVPRNVASQEPIQTPPPSGPYPVGQEAQGAAKAPVSTSTALALQPVKLVRREPSVALDAWDGKPEGQALRRAARLADRVVVLVRSGDMTALEVNAIKSRLGRKRGVGYICLAVDDEFRGLPDRVGEVGEFWST